MLGLGGLLMLAGCATSTPQQVQAQYVQACSAYLAGITVALDLRQAGKLSKPQIDQITLIDNQIAPLCVGPLPADPTAAAQQVTAAVTTLAILEAVHQEK